MLVSVLVGVLFSALSGFFFFKISNIINVFALLAVIGGISFIFALFVKNDFISYRIQVFYVFVAPLLYASVFCSRLLIQDFSPHNPSRGFSVLLVMYACAASFVGNFLGLIVHGRNRLTILEEKIPPPNPDNPLICLRCNRDYNGSWKVCLACGKELSEK